MSLITYSQYKHPQPGALGECLEATLHHCYCIHFPGPVLSVSPLPVAAVDVLLW